MTQTESPISPMMCLASAKFNSLLRNEMHAILGVGMVSILPQ